MLDHGGTPKEIIEKKGLGSIGSDAIETAIEAVIKENESAVQDYQAGKNAALNFLVGQVMKYTRGRAEPKEVRAMLKAKIKK
jgi:aspartyl-tRNA(Asn)/glutamyl-tRNA(Gln) amidotransferase subunit B